MTTSQTPVADLLNGEDEGSNISDRSAHTSSTTLPATAGHMEIRHTVEVAQPSTSLPSQTQQLPSTSSASTHPLPLMAYSPGILADFGLEESNWRDFNNLDDMNAAEMDLMSPTLVNQWQHDFSQWQHDFSEPSMGLDPGLNSYEVILSPSGKACLSC